MNIGITQYKGFTVVVGFWPINRFCLKVVRKSICVCDQAGGKRVNVDNNNLFHISIWCIWKYRKERPQERDAANPFTEGHRETEKLESESSKLKLKGKATWKEGYLKRRLLETKATWKEGYLKGRLLERMRLDLSVFAFFRFSQNVVKPFFTLKTTYKIPPLYYNSCLYNSIKEIDSLVFRIR